MQQGSPTAGPGDPWARGAAYEPYIGRWSRLIAHQFLDWLDPSGGKSWLDVGCGTGALSEMILRAADPSRLKGVDASEDYIAQARSAVNDPRASFEVGDARQLTDQPAVFDASVSGLALNFIPQPEVAVREMARVVRPGGTVASYVWDYAGKMQMLRHFWNAAAALDPVAVDLDEGRRFPLCQPAPLETLFEQVGLASVEVKPIDVSTDFKDFDDFWNPFLGGQGPAPSYAMSLNVADRAALRDRLRASLPFAVDGSIPMVARAWAVRGRRL